MDTKTMVEQAVKAVEEYAEAAKKEGELRAAFREAEYASHMAGVEALTKRALMEVSVLRLKGGAG